MPESGALRYNSDHRHARYQGAAAKQSRADLSGDADANAPFTRRIAQALGRGLSEMRPRGAAGDFPAFVARQVLHDALYVPQIGGRGEPQTAIPLFRFGVEPEGERLHKASSPPV